MSYEIMILSLTYVAFVADCAPVFMLAGVGLTIRARPRDSPRYVHPRNVSMYSCVRQFLCTEIQRAWSQDCARRQLLKAQSRENTPSSASKAICSSNSAMMTSNRANKRCGISPELRCSNNFHNETAPTVVCAPTCSRSNVHSEQCNGEMGRQDDLPLCLLRDAQHLVVTSIGYRRLGTYPNANKRAAAPD